jgi:N-acetylmuramoyl-L-alanine amidase
MLRLPHRMVPISIAVGLLCGVHAADVQPPADGARVQAIRFWSFGDVTRIAIQTEGEYKLTSDQIQNPSRAYFDLNGLRPPATAHRGIQTIQVSDPRVKQIRVAEVSPGRTRIVFDLEGSVEVVSSQLVNPDRLMIEVRAKNAHLSGLSIAHSAMGSQRVDLSAPLNAADQSSISAPLDDTAAPPNTTAVAPLVQTLPPASAQVNRNTPPSSTSTPRAQDTSIVKQTSIAPAPMASAALPNAKPVRTSPASSSTTPAASPRGIAMPAKIDSAGDRSLVRVFGLKMGKVVIDPGHGGHDTGTVGHNGLTEKDLVLDVALRLGKLITRQLNAEVVYTRTDDVFLPLEERTKLANAEKADLFISIHANSSPEVSATGVETYYFNLTSDRTGLDLATRENATSTSAISDLNDLLHKAVLQAKLEESREFAQKVQSSLCANSVKMNNRSRDRGVRQAPFVVLIGATMPSVLAEIGFVSNPHDERFMKRNDQRQKIAEALCKGISQYANSLSHLQMARAASE